MKQVTLISKPAVDVGWPGVYLECPCVVCIVGELSHVNEYYFVLLMMLRSDVEIIFFIRFNHKRAMEMETVQPEY